MIVVFGTLGAGMITTSINTVMAIPTYLRIALFGKISGRHCHDRSGSLDG